MSMQGNLPILFSQKRLYNFNESKYNILKNMRRNIPLDKQEKIDALYQTIVSLESIEQCRDLFEDLCTQKELEKMAERIYAAKLLLEGKTYNQVIAEADISSATLSRVSRCVQYGNGYSQLLK